jgi:hypothetical protein
MRGEICFKSKYDIDEYPYRKHLFNVQNNLDITGANNTQTRTV